MESENKTTNTQENTQKEPEVVDTFCCATPKCVKAATMQCPTCVKLGLIPSYFCSQECFKDFWAIHKLFHQKSKKLILILILRGGSICKF